MLKESHAESQCPRVSVVIPALNEGPNLQHVLPYIPSFVEEVILVDGNSIDDTISVARTLVPDIRIIHQRGKGKGNALKEGFAACKGDIIVMLDADGSTHPKEIPRFLEALREGNDFAKGSRFLEGGGSQDITHLRRMGNYLLSQFVNALYWAHFSDLCYGYNAFWKHCLDHVCIDCDGFEVETLMNLQAHQANLRIVEVPSFEYPRIHGTSNLRTFRDGWRVLRTILQEKGRTLLMLPHRRFVWYALRMILRAESKRLLFLRKRRQLWRICGPVLKLLLKGISKNTIFLLCCMLGRRIYGLD